MLKVAGCLIMLGQLTVLSVSEHLHRGGGGDTIRIKREETSGNNVMTITRAFSSLYLKPYFWDC